VNSTCETCGYFVIGPDGGSTSRDGEMFGLCERAGQQSSLMQPARLDKPSGLMGRPGPLAPRGDGQPHSQEVIDAYERNLREGAWQYGTVYHDRSLLYVRRTFGCVEHVRERQPITIQLGRPT
jgi:hypothetical protein